jgi:hypothetical protein
MGRARLMNEGTIFGAWRDGVYRVFRARAILAGVYAVTLLIGLPLAIVLRGMLVQSLGSSLAAESAASGTNYEWMQAFADGATGLGVTFKPTIIGFGAVLENASAFLDNEPSPAVIAGVAAVYLLSWIFLAGGIIDRYARDRVTHAYGFFSASGVFFFRFLRLAVVQWAIYAVLFGSIHSLLFDRLFPRLTHDMTVERSAFLVRLALYLVFAALVAACNVVFDYAKVRAVVEDRRSMLGAVAGAARFVRRNGAATGLFLVNVAAFLVCVALYGLAAPSAGGAGWALWLAFGVGQLYVIARLAIKLTFWASETALFQARLAHAAYTASPDPTWPDSPAAEAIPM